MSKESVRSSFTPFNNIFFREHQRNIQFVPLKATSQNFGLMIKCKKALMLNQTH